MYTKLATLTCLQEKKLGGRLKGVGKGHPTAHPSLSDLLISESGECITLFKITLKNTHRKTMFQNLIF